MRYKLIVFVGPQGSGKTTLASILRILLEKKKRGVCMTKLDTHIFFTKILEKILIKIVKENTIYEKFYINENPRKMLAPKFLKKLSALYLLIYKLAIYFALIKVQFKRLINCNIFIEDEGFIFKILTDMLFFCHRNECLISQNSNRLNKNIVIIIYITIKILSNLHLTVIKVDTNYNIISQRLLQRQQKIEPYAYLKYWEVTFKIFSVLIQRMTINLISLDNNNSLSKAIYELYYKFINTIMK